jgi:hypothetical protein
MGPPWWRIDRDAYVQVCALFAAAQWDRMTAEAPHPFDAEARAIHAAEDFDRLMTLYAAAPRWTAADAEAARADILRGRDPRAVLAAVVAVRAENARIEAAELAERLRRPACPTCGA